MVVRETFAKMKMAFRILRAFQSPDLVAQRSRVISGPASPLADEETEFDEDLTGRLSAKAAGGGQLSRMTGLRF